MSQLLHWPLSEIEAMDLEDLEFWFKELKIQQSYQNQQQQRELKDLERKQKSRKRK